VIIPPVESFVGSRHSRTRRARSRGALSLRALERKPSPVPGEGPWPPRRGGLRAVVWRRPRQRRFGWRRRRFRPSPARRFVCADPPASRVRRNDTVAGISTAQPPSRYGRGFALSGAGGGRRRAGRASEPGLAGKSS